MLTRKFRLLIIFACSLLFLTLTAGYVFAGLRDEQPEPKPLPFDGYRIDNYTDAVPAPENLVCQAGDNRVDLSWEIPDSADVSTFLVYRWLTGEVPAVVASLPANCTSWADLSVQNGTRYFYLVVTVGYGSAVSGVEAQAIATPAAPPPPPPEVEEPGEIYYYDTEEVAENPTPEPEPAPAPQVNPAPAPPQVPAPEPCPPTPGGG